jgi:hypothetical protein
MRPPLGAARNRHVFSAIGAYGLLSNVVSKRRQMTEMLPAKDRDEGKS